MAFVKGEHIRAILEFYKAGYITTNEKDKLIAALYKGHRAKAPLLRISTNVEGRELIYSYAYISHNKKQLVELYVVDDFRIEYKVEKDVLFTVIGV